MEKGMWIHNILGLWNPHTLFPSIVAIISLSLFIDKDMELLLKLNPDRWNDNN
jgi:hypothetical protein